MKLASRRAIVRITANFLPVFRLLRGAKRMQTVDYVCGGSTTSQRGQVIDVTQLPEGAVRRGDLATLIGDGMSIDDLAAAMGTVGYEVLTNLGRRYHRVYKGA